MRAIIKNDQDVRISDVPKPTYAANDVRIRVAIAAYCRTDSFAAQGKIKTKERLVLGHEFSGVIDAVGESVMTFSVGDRVGIMPIIPDTEGHYLGPMCGVDFDGAFAEYVTVPATLAYRLPDTLDFQKAAYLEPMAAALAVTNAPITASMRGAILGTNRIATLTARILAYRGFANVDLLTEKNSCTPREQTYDFVVESNPTAQTMRAAILLTKPGGIIILKSRQRIPVLISVGEIVRKELRLFGTYYGSFEEAIDILTKGDIPVDDIFGDTITLEELLPILRSDVDTNYEAKKIFVRI